MTNQNSDAPQIATAFYNAFSRRDGEAMANFYHRTATFSDPVFPLLQGPEIGRMWRMLCKNAIDFSIEFEIKEVQGDLVRVDWKAAYIFSGTGRRVVNYVKSELQIKDRLIDKHIDRFSFWKWSRQALGYTGCLLGWTTFLRKKVCSSAAANLIKFRD